MHVHGSMWWLAVAALSWCVQASRTSKVFLLPEEARDHLEPLLTAMHDLGVTEFDAPNANSWDAAEYTGEFDVVWSYEFPELDKLGPLSPHIKVNHLPGNYALVTKGYVYSNQVRLQHLHGNEHFDFIPRQFRLPDERDDFVASFQATQRGGNDTAFLHADDPSYGQRWLIKNQNHRGVHFFSGLDHLDKYMSTNDMVAQCIEPMLVSGHKFDIGLYVAVSSIDPLRVYIYHNALLRMCKLKYPKNLDDTADLESYVVDDYLPPWEMPDLRDFYKTMPTAENEGTSHFHVLKQYLDSIGIDSSEFEHEIYGAVVKLIAGNRGHFQRMEAQFRREQGQHDGRGNFFEMYRFDFLVDDKGKPWLMEVNQSPNLAPKYFESGTDAKMKATLVHDLLVLVGVQSPHEASQPNTIFQVHDKYCTPKCQDTTHVIDMSCWRCPGWFTPQEATILHQSATEFLRRGGYQLVFPSADNEYARFLDGGPTPHDHAFARYVQSYAKEKAHAVDEPGIVCTGRNQCSMHGDCVNGRCVCDDGYEGLACTDFQDIDLMKSLERVKFANELKQLHSMNLRVVGAASRPQAQESSESALLILVLGNAVGLAVVYFLAKCVYKKKALAKEH
ncbi:hypothetical protein DYB32_000269 [Aphanomyces invadans]|uniref:Tubulin--tyrosine ligase-like protein 5 n=1 Tax=Aphanomyces invadans TaxID=157072 RepID=A0A418BAF0_9STRA|nr:hypothetical protein DYB32_000269 [Aphanomyces invadans]